MNKKFFIAVIALAVIVTSAFAQTKTLSAPSKTDTSASKTSTTTMTQKSNLKHDAPSVTPPDAVAAKFKTLYPAIQMVKWMQNKQGNYVAFFKNNGGECRSVFIADGTLFREAKTIQQSAAPAGVTAYMTKNFPGKTAKKIEQIKDEKGKIIYAVKYDDHFIRLDADGKEIKMDESMEKDIK